MAVYITASKGFCVTVESIPGNHDGRVQRVCGRRRCASDIQPLESLPSNAYGDLRDWDPGLSRGEGERLLVR